MKNQSRCFTIALINPCVNDDVLGAYRKAKLHSINLGIGLLASYLERELDVNVHIIDARYFSLSPEEAYKQIALCNPDLIGLSLCVHEAVDWSRKLIKLIKEDIPYLHITTGGYFPSLFPEKAFSELPDINSVVIGEGELTLYELCKALIDGVDWRSISGIAHRDNIGNVITNPARNLIPNLDILPWPKRYLAKGDGSNMEVVIEGARGCAFKCTFCAVGPFYRLSEGAALRVKSAEYLHKEIKALREQYPKLQDFRFLDPDFIASKNKQRTVQLLKLLKQSSLNIRMHAEMRASSIIINQDLIEPLKEGGLVHVNLGIESGSQRILDKMQKCCKVSDIIESTTILRKTGIDYTYGFMMITPWVLEEDILQNVNLLRNIGKIEVHKIFSEMTIIPGTTVFEELKAENRLRWQGKLCYYSYTTESPKIEHFREIALFLQKRYPQFFKDMLFIYSWIRKLRHEKKELVASMIEKQSDTLFIDIFNYCWDNSSFKKTDLSNSIAKNCFDLFDPLVKALICLIKEQIPNLNATECINLQS